MNALKLGFRSRGGSSSISELFLIAEMRIMSKHFERWKELAALASKEQDPAKLTELAHEINLVLTQKTSYLHPALRAAGPHEADQRDVLEANTEGKVCFI
jgi:hypothetical protein